MSSTTTSTETSLLCGRTCEVSGAMRETGARGSACMWEGLGACHMPLSHLHGGLQEAVLHLFRRLPGLASECTACRYARAAKPKHAADGGGGG